MLRPFPTPSGACFTWNRVHAPPSRVVFDVSRETPPVMTEPTGMERVRRAARWAGLVLDPRQLDLLRQLADWLVMEAIPAGGLGSGEEPVVYSRHLADSLLFASAWRCPLRPPRTILDIGAGVGLPGLPLAIAWPSSEVTLLERSVRRADLARRAVRLLSLNNVAVTTTQLREWRLPAELLVCRAVAPPNRLRKDLERLLSPTGVAVIGGSHRSLPVFPGFRTCHVPANILGNPAWLLIIGET